MVEAALQRVATAGVKVRRVVVNRSARHDEIAGMNEVYR